MKTQFEALILQLHVIPSFISKREGACSVCGLPGHLGGLMAFRISWDTSAALSA